MTNINVTEKCYKAFKTKFCCMNNIYIYENLQYEQENEFSLWECKKKMGNEDGKSSLRTTFTQISTPPYFSEKQRQVYLVKKISHCIYYTVNNREYICLILFTENVDGT